MPATKPPKIRSPLAKLPIGKQNQGLLEPAEQLAGGCHQAKIAANGPDLGKRAAASLIFACVDYTQPI